MKTIIQIFWLVCILMLANQVPAQTVQLRFPDTTTVNGATIDIPVYADSSLTGKGILSYQFKIDYSSYYADVLGIISAGTLSAGFSAPAYSNNIATSTITLSSAGATPLAGSGVLLFIRLKMKQAGGFYMSFNGVNNNLFNQGSPALTFKSGLISVSNPPTINAYFANSSPITIGDSVQVYVSGGTSPYTYTVVNSSVATISTSGMLRSVGIGKTKVVVQSANNIIDTTDTEIEVRALKVSIPDTTILPLPNIVLPIKINETTSSAVLSGSFRIDYTTSYIVPDSIITTGTLLQNAVVNYQNYNNYTIVSFASAVPLSGAGDLLKIRFKILNPTNSYLSLQNVFFNQSLVANKKDGSLFFVAFTALSVLPNYGEYYVNDSQQFTASGGKPPYTFSVTDTTKASVSMTGLFKAKSGGPVKVKLTDSLNSTVQTSDLQVYDAQLVFPTMGVLAGSSVSYPVFLAKMSGTKPLYSVQFTIHFPANTLDSLEAVVNNTLANNWTVTQNLFSNKLIVAIAGTTPIAANGIMLRLKAKISASNPVGTNISFFVSDVLFNESGFWGKTINGSMNVVSVLQKDIGINTIPNLGSSCNKGTQETISAGIYNYNNVSYFIGDTLFVGYILNGNAPVKDTVILNATLIQNASIVFEFKQKVNLSVAGAYTLKVFTQLAGDINVANDTTILTFQVYGTPTVSLGNDTAICSGTLLPLTAVTSATSYLWNTGLATPGILVDTAGTYWVRVTNGAGCFAYDSIVVSLKPSPAIVHLSGTPHNSVCGLDSIVLTTPTVSGGHYRWMLNGNNTLNSGDTLNQFTVKVGGTYTVRVTNGGGCSSMMPDTAIVIMSGRQAAPAISGTLTGCVGDSLQVNASTLNNVSYLWNGPNGFVATSQNIQLTNVLPVNAGVYNVYAIRNGATTACDTSLAVSVTVVVNALPVAKSLQMTGAVSFCNGDSVVLYTDSVAGNKYQWYQNNGVLGLADTLSKLVVKVAGTYNVKVTNASGCAAFMRDTMVTVSVKLASPIISGVSTLCEGDTLALVADSTAFISYKWTGPNGFSATSRSIQIPQITAAAAGNYLLVSIRNTASNSCDTSEVVQKPVTVNARPLSVALTLSANDTLCFGDSVIVSAPNISGSTYQWLRNNLILADTGFKVVAKQSGSYNVKMTNANGCASLMLPAQITVGPKPVTGSISGAGTVLINSVQGYQVTATASSTYSWFVTNGAQSSGGTSNAITVQWGSVPATGILKVVETSSFGCRGDTVLKPVSILASIPDSLILSIDSINISNQAYLNKVGIYSNITWNVSNPVSWITVSPMTGIGFDSITLSVSANTDSMSRSAMITITAGSITKQIKVIQSGNVGLSNIQALRDVTTYPNPVVDRLYIDNNEPADLSVYIMDMLGNIVMIDAIKAHTSGVLNCSILKPGCYVLKITDEKGWQKNTRIVVH